MIAIDAGNTRIKWGVHDATGWVGRGALPTADAARLREQAGVWPQEAHILACIVAGATVEGEMTSALAGRFAPIRWLRSSAETCGVRNNYDDPTRLGADRWAAMIGARGRVQGACLVVCAGTATTVDWLAADGEFPSGLIPPGVDLVRTSLARDSAKRGPVSAPSGTRARTPRWPRLRSSVCSTHSSEVVPSRSSAPPGCETAPRTPRRTSAS